MTERMTVSRWGAGQYAAAAVGQGPNKGVYLVQPSFNATAPWEWPQHNLSMPVSQLSKTGTNTIFVVALGCRMTRVIADLIVFWLIMTSPAQLQWDWL